MDLQVTDGVPPRFEWINFEEYLLERSLVYGEKVYWEILQLCNGSMLQCYNRLMG